MLLFFWGGTPRLAASQGLGSSGSQRHVPGGVFCGAWRRELLVHQPVDRFFGTASAKLAVFPWTWTGRRRSMISLSACAAALKVVM